jgi:hypothetical protein
LTLLCSERLPGGLGELRHEHPALFAGLRGVAVAAIGMASGGLTYGTGYAEARSILYRGSTLRHALARRCCRI